MRDLFQSLLVAGVLVLLCAPFLLPPVFEGRKVRQEEVRERRLRQELAQAQALLRQDSLVLEALRRNLVELQVRVDTVWLRKVN